jgi:hypothetical protein
MRTVEEIRLENYWRLVQELREELRREPTGADIKELTGISTAYASQLKHKVRSNIDSVAARKIESKARKPRGWLDTDFSQWPFPGLERSRFDALTRSQRDELQGIVRRELEQFEAIRTKLRAA